MYSFSPQILHILLESNNEVPEQRQAEWCDRILNIATTLKHTDLSHLKAGCSAAVWSALVYCGIRPTPTRTLEDIHVCKVHVSDWDLFPSPMEPPVCLLGVVLQ